MKGISNIFLLINLLAVYLRNLLNIIMLMPQIKNVIFDLGGVLLNIDYYKTANAFKALGASEFDSFYSQTGANHLFEQLETGHIEPEDFYKAMQPHCAAGTSFQQIQIAWNAILLNFRKESVQYLTTLKDRFNLYLLSNTNIIHHTQFHKTFTAETGLQEFDSLFIKAYYSHAINRRKPYPETYYFVLEDAGLAAGETLFIDDSVVNIKGALEAGLHTHLLLPAERIEQLPMLQ